MNTLNATKIRWVVFVLLISMLCISAQNASNLASIKPFYETGLKKNGVVGSSLFLINNGEVVDHDFYGMARRATKQPVDENTTFHWASITKTFTAIAIMQLRDRGRLKLDDPVIKYVPELSAVHDPWGPVDAITIRHLLSHSSGFRSATWPWGGDKEWHPFEPTAWSQIVAMLPYTDVEFKPGSRYSYSNLGIVFLGQIIQRLSGDDYEVYIDKNILKPLEMYRTYFDRAPYHLLTYRSESFIIAEGKLIEQPFDFDTGITVSNGGLNSPLTDMVKYLKFLIGDQSRSEVYEQILKRTTLEEMFQPQIKVTTPAEKASPNGPDDKESVGLGFFIRQDNGRTFIGHSGDQNGFISHFFIRPQTREGYIVSFNTNAVDANKNTRRLDGELRDYLFGHFFKLN